jgi:hypothetical protein
MQVIRRFFISPGFPPVAGPFGISIFLKVSNTPSGLRAKRGIHFLPASKNGMIAIFSENPHLPYLSNDRLPILVNSNFLSQSSTVKFLYIIRGVKGNSSQNVSLELVIYPAFWVVKLLDFFYFAA